MSPEVQCRNPVPSLRRQDLRPRPPRTVHPHPSKTTSVPRAGTWRPDAGVVNGFPTSSPKKQDRLGRLYVDHLRRPSRDLLRGMRRVKRGCLRDVRPGWGETSDSGPVHWSDTGVGGRREHLGARDAEGPVPPPSEGRGDWAEEDTSLVLDPLL